MLNRRILRIKAMQALYGYHVSVDSQKEIVADELVAVYGWDPAFHDSLDKKDYEKKQTQIRQAFLKHISHDPGDLEGFDKEVQKEILNAEDTFHSRTKSEQKSNKKRMEVEIQQVYKTYLKLLLIPSEVAFIEREEQEKKDKRYTESGEKYFFHFKDNPVVNALATYKPLMDKVIKENISWNSERNTIKHWYKDVWPKNEVFQKYQTATGPTVEDHFAAVKYLTKQLIFKEEEVDDFMSLQDLQWSENKSILRSMVTKTIQSYEPDLEEQFALKTLSLNEEDDFKYFNVLFDETIKSDIRYDEVIASKAKNWDVTRVALLDRIILKMALTEMIKFSSIPVKVTINEFIEISKQYSTPKSKQFINGILDVLANELSSDGVIKKSGRGLIDNK